jgi:hypothetical protein
MKEIVFKTTWSRVQSEILKEAFKDDASYVYETTILSQINKILAQLNYNDWKNRLPRIRNQILVSSDLNNIFEKFKDYEGYSILIENNDLKFSNEVDSNQIKIIKNEYEYGYVTVV